ncbi:(Fe-S)-binding protein [Proteiniphilum sp. UBA5480]|jgi:L-lactate dehydrogenase complex protein LldE|uniref:(Fe-S)-binding protein n=1 Tax=Proteiniphilum sp. UBA5480 TaxID=1947282 RepID=UPI002579C020|nr:(Fe-S)-binding protein [Proteiniphilum sp. UBA5480]
MKIVSRSNIGLFIPCYIDQFYPKVGIATLELLEKLGLEVFYPSEQTCCGQPLANSGAEDKAIKTYNNFVRIFSKFDYIVSPSGSCVYHVRENYNILPQTDEVRKVRQNTFELCEFIVDILKTDDLKIDFPHKVGVHQSCHGLRGLKLATPSELIVEHYSKVHRLLKKAKGIEIINLDREDECCGFGGTFSIFQPDISVKMGKDRLDDHRRNGAEVITATDMSCLMHLEGIARRQNREVRFLHIAEILNSNRL